MRDRRRRKIVASCSGALAQAAEKRMPFLNQDRKLLRRRTFGTSLTSKTAALGGTRCDRTGRMAACSGCRRRQGCQCLLRLRRGRGRGIGSRAAGLAALLGAGLAGAFFERAGRRFGRRESDAASAGGRALHAARHCRGREGRFSVWRGHRARRRRRSRPGAISASRTTIRRRMPR